MRRKSVLVLSIALVLIAFFSVVTFTGLPMDTHSIIEPLENNLDFGYDLKGGVYADFTVDTSAYEPGEALDADLAKLQAIMERRLTNLATQESDLQVMEDGRIRAQYREKYGADFINNTLSANGELIIMDNAGNEIVNASHFIGVQPYYMEEAGYYAMSFQLNEEGTALFASATETAAMTGVPLYICIDNEVVTRASVSQPFLDGACSVPIPGDTLEDSLRNTLKTCMYAVYGALPMPVAVAETGTCEAPFGANALCAIFFAGLIALAFACLWFIIRYRWPGVAGILSLAAYLLITFYLVSALQLTLNMPGLAGVFMGFFLMLEGAVALFEHIKVECGGGRNCDAALRQSWRSVRKSLGVPVLAALLGTLVALFFSLDTLRAFFTTFAVAAIVAYVVIALIARFLAKYALRLSLKKA